MSILTKVKNKTTAFAKDITFTRRFIEGIYASLMYRIQRQQEEIAQNRMLLGQLHIDRVKHLKEIKSLREVEFKVFSQFGQDGILQYLIHHIEIPHKIFVEFGVANYQESTTRFLLQNDNWSGLIMDGSAENMAQVRASDLYWLQDLEARTEFITKENINDLISSYTKEADIGLLVIDIDGNDYWIWDAITVVKPRIVLCEYNSVLGDEKKVTIPYKHDFERSSGHFSNMYYGVSVPALVDLAERKGYKFVGCNSHGNDAVFVRADLITPAIPTMSAKQGYVRSKFRDSRNPAGELTFVSGEKRLNLIRDMEVYDLDQAKNVKVAELYGL